jgi:predicted cobalt transporter CbtA
MASEFYNVLFVVTLLQIWWIAVWGITDIGINYVAKSNKMMHLIIYSGFLLIVLLFLQMNPQHVRTMVTI